MNAISPKIEPRHLGSMIALAARGPVPQAELARLLGISGATVVQIVDDLSCAGLVERRRSETDRRSQKLHLLPLAEEVLPRARERAEAVTDEVLAPLSAGQRRELVELLARFVTTEFTPSVRPEPRRRR